MSGFGYLAMSAALAAAIVFLIDVTASADAGTMGDRLIATLIGGALAVLAHVVLPDHSRIRLRQRAGELLKTEIDYAATVIKAFVHGLDHPGRSAGRGVGARLPGPGGVRGGGGCDHVGRERDLRRWLKSYRTALNAVTTSCATLESSLPAQPPATLQHRLRGGRRRVRRGAVREHPRRLARRGASTGTGWPPPNSAFARPAGSWGPTTRRVASWWPRSATSPAAWSASPTECGVVISRGPTAVG